MSLAEWVPSHSSLPNDSGSGTKTYGFSDIVRAEKRESHPFVEVLNNSQHPPFGRMFLFAIASFLLFWDCL